MHVATSLTNPFADLTSSTNELWSKLESRRSLPLHFTLHLSNRPNASLCPCLSVSLPSSSSSSSFTVTRILDPEHRMPYISLSPLFHAAGLTLIQGLLRFRLSPLAYSLSLAGLEPWDDLWVSLPLARTIAARLDLLPPLSALLDEKTALAWSLDEFSLGLSHNWRIPQQHIDAAGYSTDAITNPGLEWSNVQLLPRGQQINTLVSKELRANIVREEKERRKKREMVVRVKLVRWTAAVWEIYSDFKAITEIESEEERGMRMREMVEDLRGVLIQPTEVDVLEWMQLLTAPEGEQMLGQGDEAELVAPFSSAELARMRNGVSQDELNEILEGEDTEEVIVRLDALLRVKMRLLHRMNLLSIPLLSSAHSLGERQQEPLQNEKLSDKDALVLRPTPEDEVPRESDAQLALLNAKIDVLTAKLDTLMHEQSRQNGRATQPKVAASWTGLLSTPMKRDPVLASIYLSAAIFIVAFCIATFTLAYT